MIWINLVACVAAFVAGIGAWRMLARNRRSPQPTQAVNLAAWQQPTLPRWGSAMRQLTLIVPHDLAQVLISVLLLASINRGAPGPLAPNFAAPSERWLMTTLGFADTQLALMSWLAAMFAAMLAGTTVGASAGFALVTLFGPPVSISIAADGVRFGALLLPWRHVSSVRLLVARMEILLFGSNDPDSAPLTLAPPTRMLYEQVEGIVGEQLAARLADRGPVRQRPARAASQVVFILAVLGAVILALALYPVNAEWVWFLNGVELVALSLLGRLYFGGWSPIMLKQAG